MKQYNIRIFAAAALLCAAMAAGGCSDINEMQREWLDRGETVYVGKLDSIVVRSGLGRVQLEGDTRYMRSAVRCEVRFGDQVREFATRDIVGEDGIARMPIGSLDEGSHYFYVTTHDAAGNKSIRTEVFGEVYGDEYRLLQRPKKVMEMIPTLTDMTLNWSANNKAVRVEVEYETLHGVERRVLDGDVTSTVIASDWKRGGKIRSVTYIEPDEKALDVIDLNPVEQNFPEVVEFEVPKNTFAEVSLPTDIDGRGYGGVGPKGMWDGVAGNDQTKRYHSRNQEGVPHHLTFDMGVYADLSKVKIWGSSDNSFWNPKRVQLWGREDLAGAETTLPSDDPGWETEAREKGWKLIADFTNTDRIVNEHPISKEEPMRVRYIRYRVLEIVGHPTDPNYTTSGKDRYGLCQELTFWANHVEAVAP